MYIRVSISRDNASERLQKPSLRYIYKDFNALSENGCGRTHYIYANHHDSVNT